MLSENILNFGFNYTYRTCPVLSLFQFMFALFLWSAMLNPHMNIFLSSMIFRLRIFYAAVVVTLFYVTMVVQPEELSTHRFDGAIFAFHILLVSVAFSLSSLSCLERKENMNWNLHVNLLSCF